MDKVYTKKCKNCGSEFKTKKKENQYGSRECLIEKRRENGN